MSVYTTNFLVGSNKQANLLIKDQTISGILCSIKLTQVLSGCLSLYCYLMASKHTHISREHNRVYLGPTLFFLGDNLHNVYMQYDYSLFVE